MKKNFLLLILSLSFGLFFSHSVFAETGGISEIAVVTNCDGTQITRTAPGKFHISQVEKNLPGCQSAGVKTSINPEAQVVTKDKTPTHAVINCSGLKVITYSDGTYRSVHVGQNLPGCIKTESVNDTSDAPLETPKMNLRSGPLLDITSRDIVNYRAKLLEKKGIRFANAVRSARMRREANMQSVTNAYLMKNDAVVVSGKETGWVKVQGAELEVVDTKENNVIANIKRKAQGFTAAKYLRLPTISDLVRIEQADHAYWSDIAHTKVARYVNVRLHPNHESTIVTTLPNNFPLYIISTVDNWSLVRTDDGSIRGYIRSDYLSIEKVQRVDRTLGVR